jgi:hypothetical protein
MSTMDCLNLSHIYLILSINTLDSSTVSIDLHQEGFFGILTRP